MKYDNKPRKRIHLWDKTEQLIQEYKLKHGVSYTDALNLLICISDEVRKDDNTTNS